jgi:tetratricopeptide (TPR) repeat protein
MYTLAVAWLALGLALPSVGSGQASPNGGEFDALRQRAESARASGRLAEAIPLYRRALALHPSWLEGHWSLGTSAYEAREYETCRTAFRAVVGLDRQNGPAWAFKGLCEFELKAFKTALDDLGEGHRLGLGDDAQFLSVARYHRAILLVRFGQFDRALRAFAAFARGGNQTEPIVEGMGMAGLRLGLLPRELPPGKRDVVMLAGRALVAAAVRATRQADEVFVRLLAKYPHEPNVHYLYGLYLQPEDPVRADEHFQEELRGTPQHALATLRLAQSALTRGDYQVAERLALDAVRLAPDSFEAHRVLGEVNLKTGDIARAVAALEAARTLQPESPSVHFQLAKAYQRAGRSRDAARARAAFTRLERMQRVERGGANAVGEVEDP